MLKSKSEDDRWLEDIPEEFNDPVQLPFFDVAICKPKEPHLTLFGPRRATT